MKTAMQQLIDCINENSPFCKIDSIVIQKATKLLEKEREQILNAFVAGDERGTKDIPFNAEQYYSQTYNQE